MQTVSILTVNCGDGSTGTNFYLMDMTQEQLDALTEADPEAFGSNDTIYKLYFPDELDLKSCGFSFSDYNEELADYSNFSDDAEW